ncbi:unnamed protein product [Allacma fusca]|uniref:Glutamate decarboxylase n=1 Tax=Allacma fusca TaxID=39272 RepID=A0A8J2LJC4_9HEXA|nr:unnamed protein product [Allacma fusca]
MEMNEYLMARMRSLPEKFHIIVDDPEYVNACFWYVPKRLRSMRHNSEREHLLGEVTPIIKQKMMEKGTLMIGYQPQGDIPNFFRNIISNPAVKKADVDFLVSEIDRIGEDL